MRFAHGFVYGIIVKERALILDPPKRSYFDGLDEIELKQAPPKPSVPIETMQWLGSPVFAGRPDTLPSGWVVDAARSDNEDFRVVRGYRGTHDGHAVLLQYNTGLGWQIDIF